jgi:hypothetical protein
MLPKNLKHFRSNLTTFREANVNYWAPDSWRTWEVKCLAVYQALTKNFTTKAEMLKCYFGLWAFESFLVRWCFGIGHLSVAVRNLVLAPFTLETIPETFQAVSRNAETLALQMNHLRKFDVETIKKKSLKRFSVSSRDGNAIRILQSEHSRMHPARRNHQTPSLPLHPLIRLRLVPAGQEQPPVSPNTFHSVSPFAQTAVLPHHVKLSFPC